MDAETLTALRQSIEKWERNAVAETPGDYTTGAASCALCEVFLGGCCQGCPVKRRTRQTGCTGTPFANAVHARWAWLNHSSDAALRNAAHAAAREEAEFLRSLLPEEETTP